MSNIGYAVFGSPKGIAVVSNGLFKSLNLNKSLYLDSSHIVLDKGEHAIMIRRIPSNLNNLEKKDALLVVLYENAWQYGENRPGGFVGSAICFKDHMPNAEKMISGLLFLFSKIKENVDEKNHFKAIDSSNWNITLPDANKDFGLEDSKLNFSPISSVKKNVVLKLNSLERDAKSVLYNFALNQSFHSIDYLYASTNTNVVAKLIKNSTFIEIPLAELFNYNKHFKSFKDRLDKGNENLSLIKSKVYTEKRILENIESDINTKKNKVKEIDSQIIKANNELAKTVNDKGRAQRELDELKHLTSNNLNAKSDFKTKSYGNQDSKKVNELQDVLNKAAKTIEDLEINDPKQSFSQNDPNEYNKNIVENYFDNLPTRKVEKRKVTIGVFTILLVLLLTFAGLFGWKWYVSNGLNSENNKLKTKINNTVVASKEAERKQNDKLYNNLKKFELGSGNSNFKEFRTYSNILLEDYKIDKYEETSNLRKYVNEHKWQFWEFDYKNDQLVGVLKPGSKETYFITLVNENKIIEDFSKPWPGESKLDKFLTDYQDKSKNKNENVYQNLDEEILNDSNLMMEHFKWMIEQINGPLRDIKPGAKIKLPFFKK